MTEKLPQLILFLATAIGLLFAVILGNAIGSAESFFLLMIAAGAAGLAWLVLAGKYWWLPMAFGLGIGGFFTLPFKLYPHEIALAACVAALVPQMVLRRTGLSDSRPQLPYVFYILALYLAVHFCMSMVVNDGDGWGNVSRAYMNMLWPFVFGYYFWRHGSTKVLQAALKVIYGAALARMAFGLVNYYAGYTYTIPLINYSIDPQDLRASGSIVLVLAFIFTAMRGNMVLRALNGAITLFAVWVILLGGSRTGAATLLMLPLFAFAIRRKWLGLVATVACSGILILALNEYPKVIEALPKRATRAMSVFLLKERLDIQEETRDSNMWHRVALPEEAQKRWSESIRTRAFGTGIKPYRGLTPGIWFGPETLFLWAKVSGDMGAYESAFWTVLAVLGVTGLALYAWLLGWLLRRLGIALLARREKDITWGVLFWACLSIVQWAVFAIPGGSYPSWEVFLGLIALARITDDGWTLPAARPRQLAVRRHHESEMPEPALTLAGRQFPVAGNRRLGTGAP